MKKETFFKWLRGIALTPGEIKEISTADDGGFLFPLYPVSTEPPEKTGTIMNGVTEHYEKFEVKLDTSENRPVIVAYNEGGMNCTAVDLEQLLQWVATNRPELYKACLPQEDSICPKS